MKCKQPKSLLQSGMIVELYYNWQEQVGRIEGTVELLVLDRVWGAYQSLNGTTFVAERWKVRFLNSNFVTHRYIRTKNYKV